MIVPVWLVAIMSGWRGVRVAGGVLVSGGKFRRHAVCDG